MVEESVSFSSQISSKAHCQHNPFIVRYMDLLFFSLCFAWYVKHSSGNQGLNKSTKVMDKYLFNACRIVCYPLIPSFIEPIFHILFDSFIIFSINNSIVLGTWSFSLEEIILLFIVSLNSLVIITRGAI